MRRLFLGPLLLLLTTSPALAQTAPEPEPAILAEARAFMDTYAEDLRTGDRAGLAARYDADGAWIVHYGEARHVIHEQIVSRYLTGWEGPAAFAWRDLTFVPAGEDAVSVIGRLDWTTPEGEVQRITYNGLLVRSADGLRIRIEDEMPIPDDVQ